MNNGTKMTKNDFNNAFKAQQQEISGEEDFSKDFKEQPKEMNEEELRLNNIKPENEDADDEPIYAVSDFEGRFDYYIRFFTDIGFLDKKKLYDAVEGKIKNSGKQDKEKNKELEMLKILFDSPEEWFKKNIQHLKLDGIDMTITVPDADNVCKTNIERLNFLKTYFTEDVLKSAINKDFKGKIVINGDLYSSRVNDLFGKQKDKIVSINELCFNALKAIKTNNDVKDKLILVAGNHDVYHMDYIDGQYYDSLDDDILQDIKNKTLPYLKKWFKVETKDGKMLIFKHSPYLLEFKGESTDLSEIINNEKNCQEVGMKKIIKYREDEINNQNSFRHTLRYYFYDGFHQPNTFHSDNGSNDDVKKILASKNAKLVVGHCHAGGQIKDGCICIDDDGKYKYRVFHFEKKKDISNDKNNVDDECNSLNSTRESIYFDDIRDKIMPSVSASNLNYNDNNNLFQQNYIKKTNPNITNEEFQQILQNNKNQLPPNFDEDYIMKFRVENKQIQPPNNKTELRQDKNKYILNHKPNHPSQDNNEYRDNPIFKIKTMMDDKIIYGNNNYQKNNAYNFTKEQKNNETGGRNKNDQNNSDNYEININDSNLTFGNTGGVEQNVLDSKSLQPKKVSCEMVRNCLSSMCEYFNGKCG